MKCHLIVLSIINLSLKRSTALNKDNAIENTTKFSLNPSALQPSSNTTCEMQNGQEGICVAYNECRMHIPYIYTGISSKSLKNGKKDCYEYLELCCWSHLVTPRVVSTNPKRIDEVKKPKNVGCGHSNPGAVGTNLRSLRNSDAETKATFGEFPWTIILLKNKPSGTYWEQKNLIGGGAIIHPKVVLTIAHKIHELEPTDVKCRAGEWNTRTESEIEPHQDRVARKFVIHEDFYKPSALNDVALIILERPFDISSETPHIGVACLAPSLPTIGTICLSMGWGLDSGKNNDSYAYVLKKVSVPLVSHEVCIKPLRAKLGSTYQLHKSFVCAGGIGGAGTCVGVGDGGSPLVFPIANQRYAIAGLVSWGIGVCNNPDKPGVYVDVAEMKSWIDRKMTEEVDDTKPYEYIL